MPNVAISHAQPGDALALPADGDRAKGGRGSARLMTLLGLRPAAPLAVALSDADRRSDNAYMMTSWPFSIGVAPTGLLAAFVNHATGASLAALGVASTVARISDVFFSPLIGILSDKTRTPIGRRKPFVLVGYIGMIALLIYGLKLLSAPSLGFSAFWFALGLGSFLLTLSIANVPYQAHGGEITTDYARRSRINVHQGTIHVLASTLGVGLPFLLVDPSTTWLRHGIAGALPAVWPFDVVANWLSGTALVGVANYGRILIVLAWVTIVSSPIIIFRYMAYARESAIPQAAPARRRVKTSELLLPLRNHIFLVFALGYFIFVAGYVGRLSIYPFIVPYATGGGFSYLLLTLVQHISSMVATPLWTRIASRLERGQTMMIACAVEAIGLVVLGLSVKGGGAVALIGVILIGLPGGTVMMLPFLMASEASDYSRFRHGGDTRGLHISLISMIAKISSFIATLGLAVVGALGFNPKHGVSAHDVMTIQVVGLYAPALLVLIGGAIMMTFPITKRRHATISRRMDRRALVEAGITAQIEPDPSLD